MHKIFLCHASEDKPVAERIQLALATAGYAVFYDEQSLPPAGDFHARIQQAIFECDLFIFLISSSSIAPGKFTLTELKFARERWPSPVGRVLSVNLHNLPAKEIPAYLSASTVLSVTGSPASEVRAAVDRILAAAPTTKPRRLAITIAAGALALLLSLAVWRFNSPGASTLPDPGPKRAEYLRLVVRAISLESKPDGLRVWADMSLANIGPEILLVNHVKLGVVATAMADGSTLAKSFDMLPSATLAREAIAPLHLQGPLVSPWSQMGKVTSTEPQFSTHFFALWIQVQATMASSGKRIMLDVEAPRPMPMNCLDNRPCVAVYELNVPAGASSYKKCIAIPGQRDFNLECQTRESS